MTKIDNKEIIVSSVKSIFGAVPFAGTALNELIFDYRSTLKQKRLNNFVEILAEHFTKNHDINLDNIKTEDFSDLFESVLTRVVKTKSKNKLIRFKNVLVKELKNPTNKIEYVDLYLDLITSLSEEELIVLYHHRHFDNTYDKELDELNRLETQLKKEIDNRNRARVSFGSSSNEAKIREIEGSRKPIRQRHEELKIFRKASYYEIEDEKFFFYKQRLYSKGLLYDNGMGRIGAKPFELMNISEFGTEFIDFIMTE